MKIGDEVTKFKPFFGAEYKRDIRKGVVEYIHPQRRFFTVRFTDDRGRSFTESFAFKGEDLL